MDKNTNLGATRDDILLLLKALLEPYEILDLELAVQFRPTSEGTPGHENFEPDGGLAILSLALRRKSSTLDPEP